MIKPKKKPAKQEIVDDLFLAPSEICKKYNIQNCHFCDDIDCGDNTSEARKIIDDFIAVTKRFY